jgi:hypothetical protein
MFIMIALSTLFLSLLSCKKNKETFVDNDLLNLWTLEWYEDGEGNRIYEKPIDLPQDIMLVFKEDLTIVGRLASVSINGIYTLDKKGGLELNLSIPFINLCCEWDELFVETFSTIHSYEYNGGKYLRLLYGTENKSMLFLK